MMFRIFWQQLHQAPPIVQRLRPFFFLEGVETGEFQRLGFLIADLKGLLDQFQRTTVEAALLKGDRLGILGEDARILGRLSYGLVQGFLGIAIAFEGDIGATKGIPALGIFRRGFQLVLQGLDHTVDVVVGLGLSQGLLLEDCRRPEVDVKTHRQSGQDAQHAHRRPANFVVPSRQRRLLPPQRNQQEYQRDDDKGAHSNPDTHACSPLLRTPAAASNPPRAINSAPPHSQPTKGFRYNCKLQTPPGKGSPIAT